MNVGMPDAAGQNVAARLVRTCKPPSPVVR